jgi:hypothetical protein
MGHAEVCGDGGRGAMRSRRRRGRSGRQAVTTPSMMPTTAFDIAGQATLTITSATSTSRRAPAPEGSLRHVSDRADEIDGTIACVSRRRPPGYR